MAPGPVLEQLAPQYADALRAYLRTGNAAAFEKAMQEVITRAHTATYLRGLAERLDVSVSTLKGLSQAERAELRAMLKQQFGYLRGFVGQLVDLSPAQVAARVALYAAAAKAAYWQAWAGSEIECLPGSCPDCYSNCRCELRREGEAIYWDGPGDAHSCAACRRRIGKRMA